MYYLGLFGFIFTLFYCYPLADGLFSKEGIDPGRERGLLGRVGERETIVIMYFKRRICFQ